MRWSFKSVDLEKQIILPNVNWLINKRPEQNNTVGPTLSKKEFFLPDCLQTGTLAFIFLLDLNRIVCPEFWACWPLDRNYTISSPEAQISGLRLELTDRFSWLSSLPARPVDLGTCQTPWPYEPIKVNQSIHQSILLVLFLWRTLDHTRCYQMSSQHSESFYVWRYSKQKSGKMFWSQQVMRRCLRRQWTSFCLHFRLPPFPSFILESTLFDVGF